MRVNVDAFIIPNSAGYVNDFLLDSYKERYNRYMTDICQQCGVDFDTENDKIVQIWFTSEELKSDNLEAHGFEYESDGLVQDFTFRYGYLPYPVLKDLKEGDSIDLDLEATEDTWLKDDSDICVKRVIIVPMHITFRQLEYRYRNFGTFEECLRRVV